MNKVKFSVLLSIYYKEKPEYFRECMESIYSQTVLPDEIVLVEDGRLTDELYEAISEYECRPSEINFVTVKLEKNSGLGLALAEGIKHCSNELVARMDTDDVCVPDRFERQLNAFSENPGLDIIGGYISEFSDDMHNIISESASRKLCDKAVSEKARCVQSHDCDVQKVCGACCRQLSGLSAYGGFSSVGKYDQKSLSYGKYR